MLTPAHQFPLGVTLAPGRRRGFIGWATAGGLVIEDDYDGEFRYDRQPVGAMQALAPDHVVYAGTASKSLTPGLRLGWLAVPPVLLDEVVAAKETAGAHTSSLDQLTLAGFLTSGGYDRQIRHARLAYRRRRDRLAAVVRRHAPRVEVTGIAAGLHAVLRLPGDQSEDDIVADAAAHGLAIEGLASFGRVAPATARRSSSGTAAAGACLHDRACPAWRRAGPGSSSAGTRAAAVRASASQNVTPNACASTSSAPARPAASAPARAMPPRKPGSPAVMARWSVTASSAVPSEAASRWMVPIALVAEGMAARPIAWKAAAIDGVMVAPSPAPISSSAPARYQ